MGIRPRLDANYDWFVEAVGVGEVSLVLLLSCWPPGAFRGYGRGLAPAIAFCCEVVDGVVVLLESLLLVAGLPGRSVGIRPGLDTS